MAETFRSFREGGSVIDHFLRDAGQVAHMLMYFCEEPGFDNDTVTSGDIHAVIQFDRPDLNYFAVQVRADTFLHSQGALYIGLVPFQIQHYIIHIAPIRHSDHPIIPDFCVIVNRPCAKKTSDTKIA